MKVGFEGRERKRESDQAPKPIFGEDGGGGGAIVAAMITTPKLPDRQPTMTVEGAAADQEIISWFEGLAENAGMVQTQTLRRIIELNHRTEYLQKWLGRDLRVQDLDPAALESLFSSSVPLASHADHEPYIQRIADGDTSPLLTQEPITMLSLSSGTTDGRPKQVPFTRFSSQSTLQIFRLGAAYRSRVFPVRAGGRILEFIYSSKQFQTKGGLTVGTATTHYFASEEFKTKQKSTKSFTCSPYEVIAGEDYKQSTYCHLLLGLAFSDQVEIIASTFAYSIVQAFIAFEELWEELCEDLREGTLSTKLTSPEMRRAVMDCLTPNASLASKIEKKCRQLEESNWSNLIPNLWPNAKYIYSIMTGSMQPYLKKLRHYAGDLALVCADYGSTESWIGVNLEPSDAPERVTFTVIPTFSYFEFIPLYTRKERDHSTSAVTDDFAEREPLPLSQVKVGQQYEVVLTTFTVHWCTPGACMRSKFPAGAQRRVGSVFPTRILCCGPHTMLCASLDSRHHQMAIKQCMSCMTQHMLMDFLV
ncbi:indole-3-acetic acid-amido synthetase GH3.10-like isoform X3 [Phoenix dactylifera]|uniref:Indole-3-acetic acid-amido synthetase GH3.10-like isoform X3 n=1 Tax=Phoenix dactylifera TaxID=42345 RepID=A0A8B9ACJ8_PHODC|nr:indole-3-acetic acid-amido synthetase GH3.10-like isoform X3 [Phoenix dactylifera]